MILSAQQKSVDDLIISSFMKSIESVGDESKREDLYKSILKTQIMHNETELFEETARKIDLEEREVVVSSICRQMIDMKRMNSALSIMHFTKRYEQSIFLMEIGEYYFKTGKSDEYAKSLKCMTDLLKDETEQYYRSRIMSNAANMYILKKDNVNAIDYLTKALYATFPMSNSAYKTYAIADVSSGYIKINDRIISGILLMQLSGGSDFNKFVTLFEIYRQRNLIDTAKRMLDRGYASFLKEKDAELKTERLIFLGEDYLKIGERKKATECYLEAVKNAKSIVSRGRRVDAMIKANAFLGKKTEWDRIIEESSMITDDESRNRAIISISRGMMKNGAKDKGFAILHIIEDNIRRGKNKPFVRKMIYDISEIYVDYGDKDKCSAYIGYLKRNFSEFPEIVSFMYMQNGKYTDALIYANKVESGFTRGRTINEIILHAIMSGKKRDAENILSENCRNIKKMKKGYERTLLSIELYNIGLENNFDMSEQISELAVL